ncbi:PD-(D/E)XK nuclease family protein [Nocardioides sp. CFH 31398]|uniref:PD-(D/E)XK nuclease family protein n=1 Tax=Nocardioides sp. CFH 31398 TaxID=2919579 RepID=UPI001F05F3EC|nr:PD-(D/E)XK nuclease family protein [Nocardioides sp. CFH 31398]MCH1867425.1 PD-(D/E)XK nuclease family protein [Nocardioides sp. CFH 31398]
MTVLAPSNTAAITARRFLAAQGGIAALNVTTARRYAETLAAARMSPRRPATRPVVAAAWRHALSGDPGAFADVADHPSTVGALSRVYRDLRELRSHHLDLIASSPTPAPDLVRLFKEVEAALAPTWFDDVDLLRSATDVADVLDEPVVLYLLGRVSPGEHGLLSALAGAREVVTIDGDDRLHAASRVVHASDSDDEVRVVVRDLLVSLEQEKRVAVLYADPRPYARLLAEQLGVAGVSINGPGARPVAERAVVRSFLQLLDLADQGVPRAQLFDAVSSAPFIDFAGQLIPTARWERHSRAAGVVRGDHWDLRLRTWIDVEAPECDKRSGQDLRDFVAELRRRFSSVGETWPETVDWARDLYCTLLVGPSGLRSLPPTEQHAYAALDLAIGTLAVLQASQIVPSVRSLHDLLAVELESSIPRVGRFGDGVYVGPLSTAAGLAVDVTYIVGLSEDLYPGSPSEDVLLPDRIREQLDGALPTLRDRIEDKRRDLASAFASAPEVVASFPRGDLRQSRERLPSRWLLPTLRHYANDPQLPATRWEDADYGEAVLSAGSFAGELLSTSRMATEQEWRIRAAVAGQLSDVVAEAAHELLTARAGTDFTRFDGNLTGLGTLPDPRQGSAKVSPTALERYAGCPHAYFVERMLRIGPVENPEDIVTIPASELGTFIHECMDELIKSTDRPGAGEAWTTTHHEVLRQIAEKKAASFEQRGVTGHQRLWSVEKEKVFFTLTTMLDEDSAWRSDKNAAVHASEVEFGSNGDPGVEVDIPGGAIRLRGSADKVDRAEGRLYVTDIKTGRRTDFTKIKQDDPAPHGAKLQLPAYAFAALSILDVDLPVTAGYWFVHKDSGRVDLEIDDDVRNHYGRVLGVLASGIADGLYPAKPPENDDFTFVQCPFCNPDGLGYAGRRREWAAKAAHPDLKQLVSLNVDNEVTDA